MITIRKLGKKNVILFVIFSFLAIGIIFIFMVSIMRTIANGEEEYELSMGSYAFDINTKFIQLKEKGVIEKKWNGYYYLNTSSLHYELGMRTVVFNADDYKVYLYGDAYQISENGKIQNLNGQTEIVRIGVPSFYKLEDRKYLIVAPNINSSADFTTKNYLIVYLDKMGNAELMNNSVYIKTINPLILKTSSFEFDVANEKLIYNNEEIDLKNVIGSTNGYVPVTSIKKEDNKEINNNTNNIVNVGGIVYNQGSSQNQELQIIKYFGVKSLVPGVTYIDIDYQVVDVLDAFTSVFVIVDDGNETPLRIYLNKQNNTHRIKNLKSNYEYKLSFGYTYTDKESGVNTIYEYIDDVSVITTSKPTNYLEITKVTSDTVHFNIKIDKEYKLDSAKVKLYIDGVVIETKSISIDDAVLKDGWSSKFDINNGGLIVSLVIEEAIFNGNAVELNVKNTYVNE